MSAARFLELQLLAMVRRDPGADNNLAAPPHLDKPDGDAAEEGES
jgi:hypothetical protein